MKKETGSPIIVETILDKLVFNQYYGEIEELPFDISQRRIMAYNCSSTMSTSERKAIKSNLAKDFYNDIKLRLENSNNI